MVYQTLGHGEVAAVGESLPELSLDGLTSHLRSNDYLGQEAFELISRFLQVGIFVYDTMTNSNYSFGRSHPYYSDQRNVIVVYRPGHYNSFGLIRGDDLVTVHKGDSVILSKLSQIHD